MINRQQPIIVQDDRKVLNFFLQYQLATSQSWMGSINSIKPLTVHSKGSNKQAFRRVKNALQG